MSLDRFCRRQVTTISPSASVRQAAEKMRERRVGVLVVVDGDVPIGVLTDRDLAFRVLAEGRPADAKVSEVMTPKPSTIAMDAAVDDAATEMRRRGVRMLPVVDPSGRLVGTVSAGDLMLIVASELAQVGS